MNNLIDLTGKTALITGGSRGVGRAMAYLLARAGADVGFCYRKRKNDAVETLRLIEIEGRTGWAYHVDLATEYGINDLFAQVDKKFSKGLDIFIANAGIWEPQDIAVEKMTTQQWQRTLAINLDSVFYATREAGKRMRKGGRIIFVGSTAGQRGEAFHVDYAASKGALNAMVKGLCVEFAPREITVNCVAPGWIDTEMCDVPFTDGGRERIEQQIPLRRVATAEDVAGPIVFLCSELARHITGEILNVNGGAVLCG